MASTCPSTGQPAPADSGPRTPPTLMTISAELREIIFKEVLRHETPIRFRCPYGRFCDGKYSRHKGGPHCSSLSRCGPLHRKWTDNDNLAPARLPHFWSIILANPQTHAEAAWMITALNTIHCHKPRELECLRRDHPIPIPCRFTDRKTSRYPPRPKRDMRGIQHISLTLSVWRGCYPRFPIGRWYESASEQLARHIRPFKDLRTLELLIWDDSRWGLSHVSSIVKMLPRSIKCRFESTIGGKTYDESVVYPSTGPEVGFSGTLVVRVMAMTDGGYTPDWMVGFPSQILVLTMRITGTRTRLLATMGILRPTRSWIDERALDTSEEKARSANISLNLLSPGESEGDSQSAVRDVHVYI